MHFRPIVPGINLRKDLVSDASGEILTESGKEKAAFPQILTRTLLWIQLMQRGLGPGRIAAMGKENNQSHPTTVYGALPLISTAFPVLNVKELLSICIVGWRNSPK